MMVALSVSLYAYEKEMTSLIFNSFIQRTQFLMCINFPLKLISGISIHLIVNIYDHDQLLLFGPTCRKLNSNRLM